MSATPEIETPTDVEIIRAMKAHGGSFVERLGEAASYADPHNLAVIKSAFTGYWMAYANIARKHNEDES